MRYDKVLFVNVVETMLTEKGEKRVEEYNNQFNYEEEEYWDKLGLTPPKKGNPSQFLKLEDDEFEFEYSEAIIDINDFSRCIDNENGGSTLCLVDGSVYTIVENSDEIFGQLKYYSQTWWDKLKDKFKK